MEEWEYLTEFLWANIESKGVRDYMKSKWPNWQNPPKYTPETLMPVLNEYGKQGWELIQMQAVLVGKNYDIGFSTSSTTGTDWTNVYFCVFKRRVRSR